jgi:hypothetical protein
VRNDIAGELQVAPHAVASTRTLMQLCGFCANLVLVKLSTNKDLRRNRKAYFSTLRPIFCENRKNLSEKELFGFND